jgi:hypothetical protein
MKRVYRFEQCIIRVLLLGLLAWSSPVAAQEGIDSLLLPTSTDTLSVTGPGPFLIRPFISQESLSVFVGPARLGADKFVLDPTLGTITFIEVGPDSAFVFVVDYRFVPLEMDQEYVLWGRRDSLVARAPVSSSSAGFTQSALVSKGSISRGVMTGTGRDASIESGLRLEVEGPITDSVHIRASLTDEDTPLMPEGTTQRLDQFDRVFLEFEAPKGRLSLGDLDASLTSGQFSRVTRRVQGVELFAHDVLPANGVVSGLGFQSIASTSKGRYSTQELDIEDGVQGPYRLEGNGKERFILVLPGTERVYVDGELLDRGLTDDYIIDYTTAEITFMPSRMMGADRRVKVEFQYTTNQFTRRFLASEVNMNVGRRQGSALFTLGITAVTEFDGDSFAREIGFSAEDSLLVSESGDATIFRSAAIPVPFDPEALFTQYLKVSEATGKSYYRAIEQTPTASEIVYRVTFSRVGVGLGAYIRSGNESGSVLSNGIVFRWVGPGNGDYDAVRPLVAPSSRDMIDLRLASSALPGLSLSLEWAGTRYDQNRMSRLDKQNDEGNGVYAHFETDRLNLGSWKATASGTHRSMSSDFTTFDRVRDIEFEREWNLGETVNPSGAIGSGEKQSDTEISLDVARNDSTTLSFGLDRLQTGSVFSAHRQRLDVRLNESSLPEVAFEWRRVSTDDERLESGTTWRRHVLRVQPREWRARPFVEWEGEHLDGKRYQTNQTLKPNTFDEIRTGLSTEQGIHSGSLFWESRFEEPLLSGSKRDHIQTFQSKWKVATAKGFSSTVDFGVRRVSDASESPLSSNVNQTRDALIIGLNGEWSYSSRNRLSWVYQVQSERSARMQELYIRTGPEQGHFVWEDVNGDGVIQLDEFIPETIPGEGEYARTFFPSDTLEAVTSLTGSIRFVRQAGGSGGRLSRIGFRSVAEVSEKSRDPERRNLYLLNASTFQTAGQTLNGRLRLMQDVQLLPSNERFDMDVGLSLIKSFSDLASGTNELLSQTQHLTIRYRPSRRWQTSVHAAHETDDSDASFASRTYQIESWLSAPEIVFRPSTSWQLSIYPQVATRRERNQNVDVQSLRIPISVRYGPTNGVTMRGSLERSSIEIDGEVRGLQAYQLTEGRGPGDSWLWQLSLNAKLTEVLTATASYDGRTPSTGDTIHTGRIQFAARF